MSESVFVDKFYQMDPKHEDLIADGSELKEGMVVMIGDKMFRADMNHLSHHPHPYLHERAMENNRWCTISQIKILERFYIDMMGRAMSQASPVVTFVATYADGVKIKRSFPADCPWIVKKDSLLTDEEFRVMNMDLDDLMTEIMNTEDPPEENDASTSE